MSQERIDENQVSVEAILRSVDPADSSLDLPQVMYLAGRASATTAARRRARRAGWFWPSATVASLVLAAGFALAWTSSGDHEVVEPVVLVEREVPAPKPDEPIDVSSASERSYNPWLEYARDCQVVVSRGIEGLPEPDLRPIGDLGSPLWDPIPKARMDAWPEG